MTEHHITIERVLHHEKERQSTTWHSGTFVQPFLQWKAMGITYCDYICSLRQHSMRMSHVVYGHPACNTHAPYCRPWPVQFYRIFPHDFINGKPFGVKKNVTKQKMCVFILSMSFAWDISYSKKNWAIYYQHCILVFM